VTLPGGAGTKYFGYDAAGNQVQDSRPDNELQLTYDAAGRLTRLGEVATDTSTRWLLFHRHTNGLAPYVKKPGKTLLIQGAPVHRCSASDRRSTSPPRPSSLMR
jgi:YD repeat-containing protein